MRYVLTNDGVIEYLFLKQSQVLKQWIKVLVLLQNMSCQKRQKKGNLYPFILLCLYSMFVI